MVSVTTHEDWTKGLQLEGQEALLPIQAHFEKSHRVMVIPSVTSHVTQLI